MKLIICAYVLFFFAIAMDDDQLSKTYHKTVDVDEIEEISAQYEGDEVEMITWDGNVIMVEVKVDITASTAVFTYFERSGRYETLTSIEGEKLILTSKKKKQKSVMVKGMKKDTYEKVKIKIFVPTEFEEVEKNNWKRNRAF